MTNSNYKQNSLLFPWLCILCFITAIIFSLGLGSSEFGWSDLFKLSSATDKDSEMIKVILLDIRLPRTIVAALCGSVLAVAGVVSQGLFRNPLASPTILGTTSGGTLAAALVFYTGASHLHWFSIPLAAFMGAVVATSFIFILAQRNSHWPIENLLLAGFAINAMLGAITSLIISLVLEDYQKTSAVMHWMLGGFSSRGWEHVWISILPIFLGLVFAFKISKQLNILVLGEKVASTLSIETSKLKKKSILIISLLVGTTVSVAGALPFIGLVVPHFTRKFSGPENRKLIILSLFNGATLTMLADLVARTIRAPLELEVGVLTSLIGAPFFLWALFGGWK